MLFLHETHKVVGAREDEFEAAYREGWMPTLAEDDDARLLWYTNHAHGSGLAYNVVTITGIADGAAWERLVHRAQSGDLRAVDAAAGQPAPRRDRQDPAAGRLVAASVGRPGDRADRWRDASAESVHGGHRLAVRRRWTTTSGPGTRSTTDRSPSRRGCSTSRPVSRWRTAATSDEKRCCGRRSTRPTTTSVLVHLLTSDIPPEHRGPGTYMFDALKYRDQWESRLLRTSAWSPLY